MITIDFIIQILFRLAKKHQIIKYFYGKKHILQNSLNNIKINEISIIISQFMQQYCMQNKCRLSKEDSLKFYNLLLDLKNITQQITVELFLTYLEQNNLVERFIIYASNVHNKKDIKRQIKRHVGVTYFTYAFAWNATTEGHDFWKQYYEQLKYNYVLQLNQ